MEARMRLTDRVEAVDTHACGEPGRVIVGGVGDVPGDSMFEKMLYLRTHADDLRLRMLREPRGYPAANCNLILPPTHPDADAGFVIMEQVEYPGMSGTNTIAVTTVLIETGMVDVTEPVTEPPSCITRSIRPQARSYWARFLERTRRPFSSSFWSTSASISSPTETTSSGL